MQIDFPKISPHQKMVEIIQQFKASTLFFYSFAKDDIDIKLLVEKMHATLYEAVLEYYLDGLKVFTIGGQFSFPVVPEEVKNYTTDAANPNKKFYFFSLTAFINAGPKLSKMEKVVVSQILDGDNYTAVFQLYFENELAGSGWEIYHLPELTAAYLKRKEIDTAS